MTKKIRDLLFANFVFLFIVITIILSLYATGYRFNLTWPLRFDRVLIKTGTLALDTNPKGAIVLITSETKISSVFPTVNPKKARLTPIKIKNLLPGEYTVSFSLDDYWPYEKKLRVNPEQTTFLEDVILFKKSLPLNIFNTKAQKTNYAPNGNYAWLENDKEIINIKTGQSITKVNTNKINWVNGGKQILDGTRLINLDNNSIQDYKNLIGEVEEAKMSESNDFIIYLYKNNLAALDLSSKATTLIPASGTILNYEISNNSLVIVVSNKEKTEIKSFDLINRIFLSSEELLTAKDFSLNKDNKKNLILSDNEHKIIYILSVGEKNKIVKNIIRGVTTFKWLDENRLAYILESEIYIYDLNQNKSYLLTRFSEQINSLAWSSSNYLIYATENTIGTINLIDNGSDLISLWKGENISSLHFDDKNDTLYFSGSIGQQGGLYKMNIR